VIAAAGGATVSGMAGGSPATSGGARGARRPLTLGRLSRLKIETMECLRDCSGHQSKVTSWHGPGGVSVLSRDSGGESMLAAATCTTFRVLRRRQRG
jgi:hypothetical protein